MPYSLIGGFSEPFIIGEDWTSDEPLISKFNLVISVLLN